MSSYLRKEILELKAYSLASHPEAVKLNQNEIALDIPGNLKAKVLERLIRVPWNRYPFAQPLELRNKISQAMSWPAEGILVTNGSNVLIQSILMATAVGGKVLTVDPTFSLYEIEAKVLGNEVQKIPLGKNFSLPLDEILSVIQKDPPSVIFLANPNAPTANLFLKEDLLKLIQNSPCLVVVDEAYSQFAEYNLLQDLALYKNLVLLRTFSKAYGLGGIRMGFALAHPEIAQEISKVLLPYCVSSLNEVVVEAILEHPEIMEKRLSDIKFERAKLYQNMVSLNGVTTYPSQTNFLIFQVMDAAKVFQALLTEGVLVRDVSSPPSLPNTLRVTVGTPDENEKFLKALEKVIPKITI